MLKELWTLVKMLFASNPNEIEGVEVIDMKHFPFKGYKAMAWCGTIIHRIGSSEVDEVTINHETIHLLQAKDKGCWWKYYLSYFWNWIKHGLMSPLSANYYINKYESQAYANEDDSAYVADWDKGDISKYEIKDAKELYRSLGNTPMNWKTYVKTL